MTSKLGRSARPAQLAASAGRFDGRSFDMRFSSTPRGARLARRLVGVRLDEWGVPYGSGAHEAVVLVVSELATNAVRHGHVPGRDFHLLLRLSAGPRPVVRVEVSDTRTERVPLVKPSDPELMDGGRGLLLVGDVSERWGWYPRSGAPGKTVWAECRIA
ncbi:MULTISPECIES: ATP-binding protein [unclassified Streptomyces]|uniref:ATP-binding protein n=1 Tax=unclassified Streptomyces TaxID=2593676 RepID=UPI001660E389|nr:MULTISPECIES: ATP-binding protein [unclassified Streptomyces]